MFPPTLVVKLWSFTTECKVLFFFITFTVPGWWCCSQGFHLEFQDFDNKDCTRIFRVSIKFNLIVYIYWNTTNSRTNREFTFAQDSNFCPNSFLLFSPSRYVLMAAFYVFASRTTLKQSLSSFSSLAQELVFNICGNFYFHNFFQVVNVGQRSFVFAGSLAISLQVPEHVLH